MADIRNPAVAGQFYPANADELAATVTTLLDESGERGNVAPKALIVPHAGYIYSGPVAASAYSRLRPYRHLYTRVILLGPCHLVPVNGMALSTAEAFRTPFGDVPVDTGALSGTDLPGVSDFDATHQYEHSLEVHLPFLQAVLDDFSIVPIVVGRAKARAVANVLDALWGGDETLIVVSSDLSHYLDYESASALDAATCRSIEELDTHIDHNAACGATPVRGLLIAARDRGLQVVTLDLRNSGDTAGDKDFVVGYGAWMLFE
jgi:AmmeMemoRadiSam system protein B